MQSDLPLNFVVTGCMLCCRYEVASAACFARMVDYAFWLFRPIWLDPSRTGGNIVVSTRINRERRSDRDEWDMSGKIFAGFLKQLPLTLLGGGLDDCVSGGDSDAA